MKSIIQTESDACYRCNSAIGTVDHHMLQGVPRRRYCEEDGLKIRLCTACHEFIHSSAGTKQLLEYKRLAQTKWEESRRTQMEAEGKDVREAWIARYGRSYLDD